MIQLHSDTLIVHLLDGEAIPCSAEALTVELIGDGDAGVDPELVRNAARAVLHYFKVERGLDFVSAGEFAQALAKVLRSFGLPASQAYAEAEQRRVTESNLLRLAYESGESFELAFFPRLRAELQQHLGQAAQVIRFKGLRACVKQLTGARRWSGRCQKLNDQIVDYLRTCWNAEGPSVATALVVR